MEESSLSGLEFDSSTIYSSSSPSSSSSTQTEFCNFIHKLSPILDDIKDSFIMTEQPAIQTTIDSLEADYKRAKKAIHDPNIQSSPAKHIENLIQNLGRSLGLVLFAGHEVPMSNKQKIEALCKEMMNVKFDVSSDDETEEKTEDIDDVMDQIKYGCEEEFKNGVLRLSTLINNGLISNEEIDDEDVAKVLSKRLSSCSRDERVIILQILRILLQRGIKQSVQENMKDLKFLSEVVKSLGGEVEEQREAVGLLLSLSDDVGVRRRMGRIQGCIVMLVGVSIGDDHRASFCATELLNVMSSNTQHALHMAEAGYFKPLIKYLEEGSERSKVLMATALSRMELTDQNKASVGEQGAIQPLVKMFSTGNLEAKLSAINALQNLSDVKQNIKLMTESEPASAILAKVAQFKSILVNQDVAHQMLSLLTLSSPVVQNHLLEALNNFASHPKFRKKMKENGAIRLLSTFFRDRDDEIRTNALNLVCKLSQDMQEELTELLGHTNINILARIVFTSTSDSEKAAALGILSSLPINDTNVTYLLKDANLLPVIISIMRSIPPNSTMSLSESIASILIRFTVPTDEELQHYSVENGIIPVLIKLLSSSSETAIHRAALCLSQLSQNSLHLSKSLKMKSFCFSPSAESLCEVHNGYCSVKSTFCLVKAGAVAPLVQILECNKRGAADEAVLSCLSTLLEDEISESGCDYIVKKSGVDPFIKVLEFGSLRTKEKVLYILQRICRVEAYRGKYGECVQGVLIDLAHSDDSRLKPMAAKVLAQLELLQV
ncbi:hypothetical protein CDL12_18021 [Handroanthus impetiginosus]|uniref:Uncharacterized protein n=1 Tax=Handroanthus impetiginosus TaxID=429701 RepID=A0A2G9GVV5_9LAMI|nr:hypothetical protein CDL12_18021 [Handroanthus impetiginosus]